MFAQYPWVGVIKESPEISGRGYPQTDHAETFYPASVFGTTAVRSGQIPMWLPYSFNGIPIMEVGIGARTDIPTQIAGNVFSVADSAARLHPVHAFASRRVRNVRVAALLGRKCYGRIVGSGRVGVEW